MGVAIVAQFIGQQLSNKGVVIDLNLLFVAAAIHDFGKGWDPSPRGHTLAGVEYLKSQNRDRRLISIIKKHQFWCFNDEEVEKPKT